MKLQDFKLDVAGALVNQDNATMAAMDTSRLLDLFMPGQVAVRPPLTCGLKRDGVPHKDRSDDCASGTNCLRAWLWQLNTGVDGILTVTGARPLRCANSMQVSGHSQRRVLLESASELLRLATHTLTQLHCCHAGWLACGARRQRRRRTATGCFRPSGGTGRTGRTVRRGPIQRGVFAGRFCQQAGRAAGQVLMRPHQDLRRRRVTGCGPQRRLRL